MLGVLVLLGIAGFAIFHRKPAPKAIPVQVKGNRQSALSTLARARRLGRPVPPYLVNDAMAEAFRIGDIAVIDALTGPIALQAQSPDPEPSSTETGSTSLVIGRNSPIDGVSNEEWESFIDKLKTQTADYSTDKHIGAYHHHKERLQQLGIDPASLTDEESQYHAMAKDIAAYRSTQRALIDDFGGELIDLPGNSSSSNADGSNTHCVTMSGILGVMKAAGPKNARAWFKNPADRASHPHTTETFLRTNGLF